VTARANAGRIAAVRALVASETGSHVDAVLERARIDDPRDRGLALHLAYGVLRRRGALDAVLRASRVARSPTSIPIARACLRVGLYEAQASRTAVHAAVDQAVAVARVLGLARATGFVNAVLRKAVVRELPVDPILDLPPWLQERWRAWPDWIARLAMPARTAIVMREPGAVPAFEASPATAGRLAVPDAFWIEGPVTELPGFAEGAFWVMDPAAARVAQLARGATVLDACAAPGGKTAFLASRGATVTGVDASGRASPDCGRTSRDCSSSRCANARLDRGPLDGLGEFDVVLVDAPCTSLGTVAGTRRSAGAFSRAIRSRWRSSRSASCAPASHHVRAGGSLVYAVCSPLEEEGEGVARRLAGWSIASGSRVCRHRATRTRTKPSFSANNERARSPWGFPPHTAPLTVFIITRMQQPIRILIIDPLAPSRERLVEALSHRFDAVAVESRLKALDVLTKSKGIRLVLVSSFQLEWKGKQLSRHIRKRLGADCPVLWHYGEVDGCARVSDVVASEYKQKYGIDRFLTATLAPVEIARAGRRALPQGVARGQARDRDVRRAHHGWGTFSFGGLKQALTTDVVTPIDRLPRNPSGARSFARASARATSGSS
jgi:16S rRNA (cytosine967-C5)-methyltransferase